MPSFDLFAYFQSSLTLEHSWWLNGNHYAKTCEDWLLLQDASKGRWIGSGKEGELVALKNKGSMTEEQKKEEGMKSFYRYVHLSGCGRGVVGFLS